MKCNCFNECNCELHLFNLKSEWDGHKFWIVLSADGRVPGKFVRHASKEVADKEAKRLATQERKAFLVLETIDGFQPPEQVEQVKFKEVPF